MVTDSHLYGAPGRINSKQPQGCIASASAFGGSNAVRLSNLSQGLVPPDNPYKKSLPYGKLFLYGAPGRINSKQPQGCIASASAFGGSNAVRLSNLSQGLVPPDNPYKKSLPYGKLFLYGAPGRIRTCDHPLRRRMLYPAELRALDALNVIAVQCGA